ncbi:MAG: alkaline phosphatase family protein [Nitrososphaerota archaeon]|nr:alkaline phosphatase family protein [Nitrososphaerota archaeon]
MTLIKPRYGEQSISDLYGAILSYFGMDGQNDLKYKIGKGEKLVLIIMDALGMSTLRNSLVDNELKDYETLQLTSIFPSTTAAAMLSFYTGLTPGGHGVLGFTSYLKELGTIVNMLNLSHPSQEEQLPMIAHNFSSYISESAVPLGRRLQENGIASMAIIPTSLVSTPSSNFTLSTMKKVPYYYPWDAMLRLQSLLNENGTAFISFYISTIDTLSHHYGPKSMEVMSATKDLFRFLNSLLAELKGFTLLITADHGQTYNQRTNVVDGELLSLLDMPPFGDSRAVFMKTRNVEKLRRYFESRFPRFELFEKKEMIKHGYFGPEVDQRFQDRIGDLIAVPDYEECLVYSYKGEAADQEYFQFKGYHGGLTTEEQEVPLLVYRR